MAFPTTIPSAGSAVTTDTLAVAGHTALHNDDRDNIRALAQKVGTGASTPTADTFLKGDGVGTSGWSGLTSSDVGLGNVDNTSDATKKSDILTTIYPIGSLYISTLSTNPNTLLGFGTWEVFGAGKMLISLDAGDTDFDTSEETGGAKTATIAQANLPNISTGAGTAHTHIQDSHTHGTGGFSTSGSGGSANYDVTGHSLSKVSRNVNGKVATNQNESAHTHSLGGSGTAMSIMNPYIAVFMWKRTA